MSFECQPFDLTIEHPWTPVVVDWFISDLREQDLARMPLTDAVESLRDPQCTYYGLIEGENENIPPDSFSEELLAVGSLLGPCADVVEMRLEHLVVHPDHRGEGLGSLMLHYLEDETVKAGAGSLWLYPTGDPRVYIFYEARGYKFVHHPHDDEARLFTKRLG
jgi:GNAT superfamily N-acetyltransferase